MVDDPDQVVLQGQRPAPLVQVGATRAVRSQVEVIARKHHLGRDLDHATTAWTRYAHSRRPFHTSGQRHCRRRRRNRGFAAHQPGLEAFQVHHQNARAAKQTEPLARAHLSLAGGAIERVGTHQSLRPEKRLETVLERHFTATSRDGDAEAPKRVERRACVFARLARHARAELAEKEVLQRRVIPLTVVVPPRLSDHHVWLACQVGNLAVRSVWRSAVELLVHGVEEER
mmetsp:Transcript_4838/g.12352  ORF Transcript_4838/g.12352 Transcript_4838/m.12352 type:complete len:229 (-) Transcript_4838:764-1450(-)